jgi:hypothetical protein
MCIKPTGAVQGVGGGAGGRAAEEGRQADVHTHRPHRRYISQFTPLISHIIPFRYIHA